MGRLVMDSFASGKRSYSAVAPSYSALALCSSWWRLLQGLLLPIRRNDADAFRERPRPWLDNMLNTCTAVNYGHSADHVR